VKTTRKTFLDQSKGCEKKIFKNFSQTLVGEESGGGGAVGKVGGWGERLRRDEGGWEGEDG
jgi:hypothetical protein